MSQENQKRRRLPWWFWLLGMGMFGMTLNAILVVAAVKSKPISVLEEAPDGD